MDEFSGWGLTPDSDEEDTSSILLSFGDLMSGLLMIFALLFIVVLFQLQDREEQLKAREEQLREKEEQLEERGESIKIVIGAVLGAMKANNIDVKVEPETGDISVRNSILFDENSAELKPAGKELLKTFIPEYTKVIFSKPEFEDEITRVIIEGHTSSKGSYEDNMKLSQSRSMAVINYIFSELDFENKEHQQKLEQKIMAAGRGEVEANQNIDDENDRKVTFRFQFRGQEIEQFLDETPLETEEQE